MTKFQAVIYRTSASCGYMGKPARSVEAAFESARLRAGRMFVLGLSCSTGEKFSYDATAFLEDAEAIAKVNMRWRRNCARYSVRDGSSDCTLELIRL